jgi:hypothetical protein
VVGEGKSFQIPPAFLRVRIHNFGEDGGLLELWDGVFKEGHADVVEAIVFKRVLLNFN